MSDVGTAIAVREQLFKAAGTTGFTDVSVMQQLVPICERLGDRRSVEMYLETAHTLLESSNVGDALFFVTRAWHVQAHAHLRQNVFEERELFEFHRAIAARIPFRAPTPGAEDCVGRKLRLVHVPSGLSAGHGPSEVLRSLMRHHDRERFDVSVVVTDYTSDSYKLGADVLDEFAEHADVHVLQPPGVNPEKAQQLLDVFGAIGADIVVFHTGVCPISDFASMQRCAPVMTNFSHGGVMFSEHIDHRFVQGRAGLDALPAEFRETATPQLLGSDFHVRLDGAEPLVLDPFGPGVVRFGSIGALYKIAHPEFLDLIARLLKRVPDAVFVYAGRESGDGSKFIDRYFTERGLGKRVKHVGYLDDDLPGFLLGLDVYLNSYPVPGGLSVLNAMAAGLPVLSLKTPSSGYLDVSYEYVDDRDLTKDPWEPKGFVKAAERLANDAEYRREKGARMRERYDAEFHYDDIVHRIDDTLVRLYDEKTGASS